MATHHSLPMTLEEVRKRMEDNGFHINRTGVNDLSYEVYMCLHDKEIRENIRGRYIYPAAACVAVKLFGVKLKISKLPWYVNSINFTPVLGYVPG